jgi:hypothetical protein
VKGCKQRCTSNAMDGTDDDVLRNGSDGECKEGEGSNCEDGDSDTDW